MIKLLTIIGARPQIIKAAALNRSIRSQFADKIQEVIVHTGQHYDDNMSKVFFDELNVPAPKYNLGVGSESHGKQTAAMIDKIEEVLKHEKPEFVVLYGDTNSTLAGSIAAAKLHFPIIHIEAGLRSFNKTMPEEINRIVCDHTSTLLFCPTKTGINNLEREGFNHLNQPPFTIDHPGLFISGDIMLDNTLFFSELADQKSTILKTYHLEKNSYLFGTIHREENTDNAHRMASIFEALNEITTANNIKTVLPLHPRTLKVLAKNLKPGLFRQINTNQNIKIIPPVSFFDTMILIKNSQLILTDSGGVQKEAYFHKKPVLVLRSETEWIEILENRCGRIVDADPVKILAGYQFFQKNRNLKFPMIFGNGKAAEFICNEIVKHSKS
jgi:UDP-GlcNAc3NAcA epimerase